MRLWPAAGMLLALLAGPACAQDYVPCVTAQLAHLGHSVDADPTVIGPRTAEAAAAITRDDLPELTPHSAAIWCKELGLSDASLAAFWPSRRADLIVVPPTLSGGGLETIMRHGVAESRAYFATLYGQHLVGSFSFIAGPSAQDLHDAAKSLRAPTAVLDALRTTPCGSETNPRAVAFRDFAVFCAAPSAVYDAAWVEQNQTWWTRIIAHEFVHGLQGELAGVHTRPVLPSGERTLGPKWLVEGAAEVFEEEFFASRTRFTERSVGTHRRVVKQDAVPLASLRARVRSTAEYDVGQYAADLLGSRFGRAALFEYFAALRTADSWTFAFEATFGMPLAEFEAMFETMRDDLVAAYRFAEGES